MAESSGELPLLRYPQSNAVDAVRWLPSLSPFSRLAAAAVHSTDSPSPSSAIDIHAIAISDQNPSFLRRFSVPVPSPVSALRSSRAMEKPFLAAGMLAGSLHLLAVDPVEGSVVSDASIDGGSFHAGPVAAVDLQPGGVDCVSAGEDGRVHVVDVGEGRLDWMRVSDERGLVSYTVVKWGSPAEFVTGGLGYGVQWWDGRKPGGRPVTQLKGDWVRGSPAGVVHSVDVHPSRKHICVVGGSSGTVFAWDLQWQQQPLLLCGVGLGREARTVSESEVWEVQFDSHSQSSAIFSESSSRLLPVMMCSEDGILAVVGHGDEPVSLLEEHCAINSFDIDPQNPSVVICALEWESIGILMRPRGRL